MRIAEMVTFGGGGLDRAAECRADVTELKKRDDARTILMWRGKPLLEDDMLVRVPLDHPALMDAGDQILLGRIDDATVFASDLSGWTPDDLDDRTLDKFLDPSQQQHPTLTDTAFVELRVAMTRLSALDAEMAATARAVLGWHQTHRFCARCGGESVLSMAGWQRDCPSCGGHHFPRTDPVVIMLITHGNAVLLGRSPGWPEGMYSCLAGFIEPGETIEAAVRREVFEEAGVRVGRVDYLSSQPWPFPSSLMLGCIGEALNTDLTIDPVEIEHARWVSREELALAFAGDHPEILPARKGAIAHFLLENWLADRLD
ncbi:NAD(+) diphosphatase [Yoonia sp. 2307UL14-13]|uniref:NAD(+) diphosphatase n=1 Tax=Yoonia sp. 2307UL14-13 TaxID=3126506 RepID=UPI0030AA21ED